MAITNYGELKAAIANWLDRTDLTSKIPDFITLAEASFFRTLRCPGNEQWVKYAASPDNTQTFQIPNNYLEAKVLMYGDKPLRRISEQRYLVLNHQAPTPGVPEAFCRIKDQLYIYPEANYEADINLVFYETQGPMVDDADFTRTLIYAPDLYLYGALMEAQAYLIGDERIGVWGQKYTGIMQSLASNALDDEIGGSTMAVSDVYGEYGAF
jgi:hypothetical protein